MWDSSLSLLKMVFGIIVLVGIVFSLFFLLERKEPELPPRVVEIIDELNRREELSKTTEEKLSKAKDQDLSTEEKMREYYEIPTNYENKEQMNEKMEAMLKGYFEYVLENQASFLHRGYTKKELELQADHYSSYNVHLLFGEKYVEGVKENGEIKEFSPDEDTFLFFLREWKRAINYFESEIIKEMKEYIEFKIKKVQEVPKQQKDYPVDDLKNALSYKTYKQFYEFFTELNKKGVKVDPEVRSHLQKWNKLRISCGMTFNGFET